MGVGAGSNGFARLPILPATAPCCRLARPRQRWPLPRPWLFSCRQHRRGASGAGFGSGGQLQPQVPFVVPTRCSASNKRNYSLRARLPPPLPTPISRGAGASAALAQPIAPAALGAPREPGEAQAGPAFVTGVCPVCLHPWDPPCQSGHCASAAGCGGVCVHKVSACRIGAARSCSVPWAEHRRAGRWVLGEGHGAGTFLQLLERWLGTYCRLWQPLVKLRGMGSFPLQLPSLPPPAARAAPRRAREERIPVTGATSPAAVPLPQRRWHSPQSR